MGVIDPGGGNGDVPGGGGNGNGGRNPGGLLCQTSLIFLVSIFDLRLETWRWCAVR
jgi:hypothetical protein